MLICKIKNLTPRKLGFSREESGATAMEFAMIAPIFIWVLFLTLEFGLMLFSRSTVETVTQKVGRQVMVGNNFSGSGDRDENIENVLRKNIKSKTIGLHDIEITTTVYNRITDVGSNPFGGGSSFGARNQIVRYHVSTEYRYLTPAAKWLADTIGIATISSTIYVKNEAF